MSDNNKENNIKVFQFSKLTPEPKFEVVRNKKWMDFGKDNLLPEYIKELLDDSPAHAAIVAGTATFVSGEGWEIPDSPSAQLQAFFDNKDPKEEEQNNLDDVLRMVAMDLKTYGAFALNVRWSVDGKNIGAVHHIDVSKIRLATNTGSKLPHYYVCADWSNTRKNVPKIYQGYSVLNRKERSQILYVKLPKTKNPPYGMPDYWAAREAIEIDQSIQEFQLRRLKEGFFPSVIITVPSLAESQLEQDKMYDELKDFFGGNSGAAAIMDGEYKFEKFEPSSVPDDFMQFQRNVNQKIKEAHRVPAKGQLFGLSDESGGMTFSNEQLLNEFELFNQTIVRSYQRVIEDTFNKLAKQNGISEQMRITKYALNLDPEQENNNEESNIE